MQRLFKAQYLEYFEGNFGKLKYSLIDIFDAVSNWQIKLCGEFVANHQIYQSAFPSKALYA